MITDKRMKFVKSEDGMDYYIFSPSLTRQYYNKTEEWTEHRKSLTHKIHMILYHLRGGVSDPLYDGWREDCFIYRICTLR